MVFDSEVQILYLTSEISLFQRVIMIMTMISLCFKEYLKVLVKCFNRMKSVVIVFLELSDR